MPSKFQMKTKIFRKLHRYFIVKNGFETTFNYVRRQDLEMCALISIVNGLKSTFQDRLAYLPCNAIEGQDPFDLPL